MNHRRQLLKATALALPVIAAPAQAQSTWTPVRPISLVVPYPAGGPTDILARTLAVELTRDLGQSVIVENVPGGAGAIGTRRVAQSAPDGHTLVFGTNQTHATNISLLPQGGGYDPIKDFVAIAGLADLQHLVVVGNEVPVRSASELVALARKEPGKLTAGSTGPGSASHLALELFKSRTGADIAHVPYKGSAPLLNDLLGHHVNLSFATTPTVLQAIQSGRLRAIAVASPNRSPFLPDLPTPGTSRRAWRRGRCLARAVRAGGDRARDPGPIARGDCISDEAIDRHRHPEKERHERKCAQRRGLRGVRARRRRALGAGGPDGGREGRVSVERIKGRCAGSVSCRP